MNDRETLARQLTEDIWAQLHAAGGRWVAYPSLLALAPEGRVVRIPELEAEQPFAADYAHGGAYDAGPSGKPDGRMLEDCLARVRRRLGSTPQRLDEGYPRGADGKPGGRSFRLVPATDVEPVGLEEIAQRLGVQRGTVDMWRQRSVLPEPWWTVGGRPAWPWRAIREWACETGRLEGGSRHA